MKLLQDLKTGLIRIGIVLLTAGVVMCLFVIACDAWLFHKGRELSSNLPALEVYTRDSVAAGDLRNAAVALDLDKPSSEPVTWESPAGPNGSLNRYLEDSLIEPSDQIENPPPVVEKYLRDKAAAGRSLRRILTGSKQIYWKSSNPETEMISLPPIDQILNLQRYLLADAVSAAAEGDSSRCREDFQASALLNQPVLRRHEITSKMTAMYVYRLELGVLRKNIAPPESWVRSRIQWEQEISRDLQYEAAWLRVYCRKGGPMQFYKGLSAWAHRELIARPFMQADALDLSNRLSQELRQYSQPFGYARFHASQVLIPVDLQSNIPAQTKWPHLDYLFGKVARLQVDEELTEKVITLRKGEPIFSQIPSKACPENIWIIHNDGRNTVIALSGNISFPDMEPNLPLYHILTAP